MILLLSILTNIIVIFPRGREGVLLALKPAETKPSSGSIEISPPSSRKEGLGENGEIMEFENFGPIHAKIRESARTGHL